MNQVSDVVMLKESHVPGLGVPLKGKITRRVNGDGVEVYNYEMSHYCRPSATAIGIYYPSSMAADSLEGAEATLEAHMRSFTAAFGVQASPGF